MRSLSNPLLKLGRSFVPSLESKREDDFLAALERGGIDLIVSDFDLPSFDGVSAAENRIPQGRFRLHWSSAGQGQMAARCPKRAMSHSIEQI